MKRSSPLRPFWLLMGLLWSVSALAAEGPLLREATFEDLANTIVTTVSRREERAFTAPAATTVLTGDAIARSGAASVPEALRAVPGFNVAEIAPAIWAVGGRGFQWQLANKLLVMIDGRSIYSPAIGGVPWEDNPVFLDDIARIEAVRGPGATFWGANAVNGVIDIVTRDSFETIGTRAFARVGDQGEFAAGFRQGIRLADNVAIRFYGQHEEESASLLPDGTDAHNGFHRDSGGLRLDWIPAAGDHVTLQAGGHERSNDYVRTISTLRFPPSYDVTSTDPARGRGQQASGSWRHTLDDGGDFTVSGYVDHVVRDRPQFIEDVRTANIEGLLNLAPRSVGRLSVGAGYRWVDSQLEDVLYSFQPVQTHPMLFNAFVNDEVVLQPDRLRLSVGSKVEWHSATGWNLQPSARLTWEPAPTVVAWGAVGRAVRVPTVLERTSAIDAAVYSPGLLDVSRAAVVRIYGNPDLRAESMTAIESGVRWAPAPNWQCDLAAFTYHYRDYVLVTEDPSSFRTQPDLVVIGERFSNGLKGEAYGGELTLGWEPRKDWRFSATCSYVQIQLHTGLSDPLGYERDEDTTPDLTVTLACDWQLSRAWSLHLAARNVDDVPYYGIPAYTAVDVRLAWRVNEYSELALVARNLADPWHPEYDTAFARQLAEIGRTVSVRYTWSY